VPDLCTWAGKFNSAEAERLSGIHHKIAQIKELGVVKVIGGITTGGNDEVFEAAWPNCLDVLRSLTDDVPDDGFLLLYVPHPFWAQLLSSQYQWFPTWHELFNLFDSDRRWTVFQYSPSFDAAGRYFFIAQKRPTKTGLPPESLLALQTFRVFFHPDGADLTQGNSSRALSAHLCHALVSTGATVYSYSLKDTGAVAQACPEDILIGHVGPWVRTAYDRGLRKIILYNPVNRWYPTRNRPEFEANATIAEQVAMSRMVIGQSGAIWRLTADYPQPDKWRWIDLGIEPLLFPRVKREFNPAGQRRFCFAHLYDAAQKGSDIAREIIGARPEYEFSWVGGEPFSAMNVRSYSPRPNTHKDFQRVVGKCDFILVPSREDAQPGIPVEGAALGLIPVTTYTSGYSISYPRLVEPNTLEEWLNVIDYLQNVPEAELGQARSVFDAYLGSVHNWHTVESQIVFYLREFVQREVGDPCNLV